MIATLFRILINAAVLTTGATFVLWVFLRITPRWALNASTRYALWWIALLLAVVLPVVFVPSLHIRNALPPSLGALPMEELARLPVLTVPKTPIAAVRPDVTSNSTSSLRKVVNENEIVPNVSIGNRLRSLVPAFPIRVRAGFWMELVLTMWLLASTILLVRLAVSYLSLSLRCARAVDSPESLQRKAGSWIDECKITTRRVRFAASREIDTPLAIGLFRCAILIPDAYSDSFIEEDLKQIVVHEAAHLGRGDDVALLLQRFIEALLPWHPAVRWIARLLDFEREVACDDWVVKATGHSRAYAMCLTRVAEYGGAADAVRSTPTVIGMRSDLARRVDCLLNSRNRLKPQLLRVRFAVLATLLVGGTFFGGKVREAIAFQEPVQTRSKQVQEIIDAAPGAPPELAADILLTLVERGEVTDAKQKRQLIEEAWDLAPKAKYQFDIAAAVGMAFATDSDTGSLVSALRPGLSTDGLQARVITQMVTLDPKAARELFLRMTPPQPEFPSCSADRYASHGAYFKMLETVLRTYSAEENRAGDRTQFLLNGLRSLVSPEDLRQALSLIQSDKTLTDADYRRLLNAWAETLSRAHFSDRVYSAQGIKSFSDFVIAAAKQAKSRGGSTSTLLMALRSYFVRHSSALRCEDSSWRMADYVGTLAATNSEETARSTFNGAMAELAPDVIPILAEEIRPSAIAGKSTGASYQRLVPDESKWWQLHLAYQKLRFGLTPEQQALVKNNPRISGMAPYLTVEQRSTPEWNQQALRFLTQLETYSREFGESDREGFWQKSMWYNSFLELVPDGRLRDTLIRSYVNFFSMTPIEHESPPEWAMWVNRVIGSVEVRDRKEWLDQIDASGDGTIAIYTGLARLKLDSTTPPH
jgi:beta-lactamase regulating signal transducer with metallopeptidase domain